jgi:hypothetical protein
VGYNLWVPEGREISARQSPLAQSHLSKQSSHFILITRHIADALWLTGSFPFTQQLSDFVKAKASDGIEVIDQLVLRLESIFMVDITSSDMRLLFEAPGTVFDDMRMAKETGFDRTLTPGGEDVVAGTTEVGVERSVGEGQGEDQRAEILLKAKVILKKDIADLWL